MKKDIFIKFANNAAKAKAKRLYKNITAEEVQASLKEEADAFEALAEQLAAEAEDSEALKVVQEALTKVQEAQTALKEKLAAIETAPAPEAPMANGKQRFSNAVSDAVKAGLVAGQSIARLRFANANNANFNVPFFDDEITLEDRKLPSFLEACRQIPMSGQTSVVWNEVESGTNVAAIVAIGDAKPVKTNSTSASVAGTNTLAEIVKLPVQYKNAAPILQDIFEKDLADDVNDKADAQVQAVIATAANAYSGVSLAGKALWQAILAVANKAREYKPAQKVYVWISTERSVELDLMASNTEGIPYSVDFASKGIEIRTFVPNATYTKDKIFAAVEGKIRFYNDGLDVSTSDQVYWTTNQIGLRAEYLNEVIVLRGSDVINTIYDDLSTLLA